MARFEEEKNLETRRVDLRTLKMLAGIPLDAKIPIESVGNIIRMHTTP